MTTGALFRSYGFGIRERAALDRDGHFLLPALLTAEARRELTAALAHIRTLNESASDDVSPGRFAAEFDSYLESLIAHPQLLELARLVLGPDIRFDHCVALSREGGNPGTGWHAHEYSDDDPRLGFVRIFFYVNGFEVDDGGLKVVRGSHLFRDQTLSAATDADLSNNWMKSRSHPHTGEPLCIEPLSAPSGTVALMWTHAAHGVSARKPESETRWTVVYAYRNPGRPSAGRWINPEFEAKRIPGAEGLMSLY